MSDFLNWELTNRMHNLGYDGKTLMYIDDEEDIINDNSAELIGAKPAILTSAAFRWFREKHNLHCAVNTHTSSTNQLTYICSLEFGKKLTYEKAELACLDKLLEIVESKSSL